MEDKIHSIITRPHEYEATYFGYKIEKENTKNSYIDIHLKKGNEVRKLRFLQPTQVEIEKGFNGNICGMEILDIRKRQLEGIGIEVRNFEQDAEITFLAREVEELME